jgi:hypothetical protein
MGHSRWRAERQGGSVCERLDCGGKEARKREAGRSQGEKFGLGWEVPEEGSRVGSG